MKNKIQVRVIPVPKPYSTECGLCLELDGADGDRLEQFAVENGMWIQRIQSVK